MSRLPSRLALEELTVTLELTTERRSAEDEDQQFRWGQWDEATAALAVELEVSKLGRGKYCKLLVTYSIKY